MEPIEYESPYARPRTDSVPEGMKRCTRCEVDYPATEEHFHRSAWKFDGLDHWCKTCVSQRSKRYRQMTGRAATHREDEGLTSFEPLAEEPRGNGFLSRLRFGSIEAPASADAP